MLSSQLPDGQGRRGGFRHLVRGHTARSVNAIPGSLGPPACAFLAAPLAFPWPADDGRADVPRGIVWAGSEIQFGLVVFGRGRLTGRLCSASSPLRQLPGQDCLTLSPALLRPDPGGRAEKYPAQPGRPGTAWAVTPALILCKSRVFSGRLPPRGRTNPAADFQPTSEPRDLSPCHSVVGELLSLSIV